MKRIFLLLLIINYQLSIINSSAQPAIQWQKCLGGTSDDYAYSIQQTADGGYIAAGFTESTDGDVTGNHGNRDYWVVKLDNSGTLQWQKWLGGGSADAASYVQQTSDGGFIVAGNTGSNDGDVTGNHGYYDFWIVKLNSSGMMDWQKCYGGTGDDVANSIQQTSDGGFIAAGYTSSTNGDVTGNHGNVDYWIVKLDALGNIQWQKCLGGTADEKAVSIQQTNDAGYIVAGWTNSNDGDVTGNYGSQDYWIVKLDSSGTLQWQQCRGGTSADEAHSIQQTFDGGFIVAGLTESTNGDVTGYYNGQDYWIVKLDNSGTFLLQKCLGGYSNDGANAIRQTIDGDYVVAGSASSNNGDVTGNWGIFDYWVVKLNSAGIIQWQKCLGGTDYDEAYSIHQTTDGGFIVAGSTLSTDGDVTGNHGGSDFWIVKLAPVIGIEEETSNSLLNISPNPFTTQATISFNKEVRDATFSLYNLLGEKVAEVSGINGESYQFNRGNQRSGVYVFEVSEGRSIWKGKAVVY